MSADLVPFVWTETDRETYEYRLGCLWPACNMARGDMFLLGEPEDHNAEGQPVFCAHLKDTDGWWAGSRAVTLTEFMALERREVIR